MFALLGACVAVAYHLVSGLARILAPLAGGLAPVLAIIACTAAVRLLLAPLSYYSLRGQASQARLLPKVRELQQRHEGQPDRLQRELSQLYKREGTGVLAGCLPALLQLPFFSVLYRLLESRTIDGRPNSLLSHDLLGAPLGSHWLGGPGPVSVPGRRVSRAVRAAGRGRVAVVAVRAPLRGRDGRATCQRWRSGQDRRPGWSSAAGRRDRPGDPGAAVHDRRRRGGRPAGGRPLPAHLVGVGGSRAPGAEPESRAVSLSRPVTAAPAGRR